MARNDASFFSYNTPWGKVTIGSNGPAIVRLVPGEVVLAGEHAPNAVTNRAATQLQEYFAGQRRMFDLPLAPSGTLFQMEVWRALELIP